MMKPSYVPMIAVMGFSNDNNNRQKKSRDPAWSVLDKIEWRDGHAQDKLDQGLVGQNITIAYTRRTMGRIFFPDIVSIHGRSSTFSNVALN